MTSLQELDFPVDFYLDEVIDGFFVSETMKRYWAAQLVVLSEIDKICKRHDINWYADSGTMLGAVRHKGYIPWDDDLDIAMFREDYKRFLIYARKELSKDEYRIFSSEDSPFDMPFGRISNIGVYDFDPERLIKFQGCPISVGIDIFPFDNIYTDKDKEDDRVKRGRLVYSTLVGIRAKVMPEDQIRKNITIIEKENNISIGKDNPFKDLQLLFESIAQECKDDESDEIAVMSEWLSRSICRYHRCDYDKYIEMPFETTYLRVPSRYREILTACYGDYMKPVRGIAVHDYPIYRELEVKFLKRYGKNPTLRYHFDKDGFEPKKKRKTYSEHQKDLLTFMYGFHKEAEERITEGKTYEVGNLLETCQNAAVTIGNSLEGKYGEGTEAVHALEEYCEIVYEASLNWTNETRRKLDHSLAAAEENIDKLIASSKKEILFLLCRSCWWDSIKEVYAVMAGIKENNIHAIPIPYSFLDHTKNLIGWKTDLNEFERIPELKGRLVSYEEYRPEIRRPDVIVIQYPYDGNSGILAIPQELFSYNLLDCTDELVFVPYLQPDTPESVEDVAYAAMQEYIEQPAVFNADKVLVGSNKLREFYVRKLMDMTDENLKDYWERRICTKENL